MLPDPPIKVSTREVAGEFPTETLDLTSTQLTLPRPSVIAPRARRSACASVSPPSLRDDSCGKFPPLDRPIPATHPKRVHTGNFFRRIPWKIWNIISQPYQ
jgi:hypothetical protein